MRIILKTLFVGLLIMVIGGCDTTDSNGGNDNGPPPPPPTFTLSTDIIPEGAGSVSPVSGSFNEGSQVSVEASANDGFEFIEWTGTITSEDNPLQFTIDQETNLTANFADFRSVYLVTMSVADSQDGIELEFGQQDEEVEEPAPPSPPEGALDARFVKGDEELFADIRLQTQRELIWQLQLQPGEESELTLSWQTDDEKMEGSLVLTDSENSSGSGDLEVDMKVESSVTVNADEIEVLYIHYILE